MSTGHNAKEVKLYLQGHLDMRVPVEGEDQTFQNIYH